MKNNLEYTTRRHCIGKTGDGNPDLRSGWGGQRYRGGRVHHVHGTGEQQQDTRQEYRQQHRYDRLSQVGYLHFFLSFLSFLKVFLLIFVAGSVKGRTYFEVIPTLDFWKGKEEK